MFLDVPFYAVASLIDLAILFCGEDSVLSAIALSLGTAKVRRDVDSWKTVGGESHVRKALGLAAKSHGWFKRIDRGEALGQAIALVWEDMADSPSGRTMLAVEAWSYGQ